MAGNKNPGQLVIHLTQNIAAAGFSARLNIFLACLLSISARS